MKPFPKWLMVGVIVGLCWLGVACSTGGPSNPSETASSAEQGGETTGGGSEPSGKEDTSDAAAGAEPSEVPDTTTKPEQPAGSDSTITPDTQAPALTYPIVDTGQAACYNAMQSMTCPTSGAAFFGQDSQYVGLQPSYKVSTSGLTVLDNVTGLHWQRSPDTNGDGKLDASDKMTFEKAKAYCQTQAQQKFDGFDDWRLPSIKELYSLIMFYGTDPSGLQGSNTEGLIPFIDTTVFKFAYGDTSSNERVIDAQYASSTKYVNKSAFGEDMLFGVNFADGRIKGYDVKMPNGKVKTFTVMCVRGNPKYGINEFVDNGDQTITDKATGLMWTKPDSGKGMDWEAALAWVETKNKEKYLGYSDWRLPNAKELQSILDYTRSPDTTDSAAIAPIFEATSFINEDGKKDFPWYWASTSHVTYRGRAASAVYLAFGRAGGWQQKRGSNCYNLNDVHGAGAQRSDPKTSKGLITIGTSCSGGDAFGHGPQGDSLRASNYVRLVRGGAALEPGGGPRREGGVLPEGGALPDRPPTEPSSPCGTCPQGQVCCAGNLPCKGQCVPDCRKGAQGCPQSLKCDTNTGVCTP